LRLANPITSEREYLRRSLLPTLLEALALNLRENDRVLLFEIGRVYLPREGRVLPNEPRRLAIAMAGRRTPLAWLTPGAEPIDFFDLKGVVETLLARLNIDDRVRFVPLTDDPRFHPGRAARMELRTDTQAAASALQIGVVGELHPDVCERLEINAPHAAAAEIDLEQVIAHAQPAHYRAISRYPAISQDIAVVAGLDVPAERIAAIIRTYAGPDLESLTLFDVYEGPQVGPGRRSLTYRLTFRSMERTLSDADVNKVRARIVAGLEREVGATIRG
jgi:phenylalanyl-tRNA synthetase beta chain